MNSGIKKLLLGYDPVRTASVFSALLLNPKYQYHTHTLEVGIKVCLTYCKGTAKPTLKLIKKLYKEIHFGTHMYEDPVEDIFAARLWFGKKSYMVRLGLWEGCIHNTQIALHVLESLPDEGVFLEIKKNIESVLSVSDFIIKQNKLEPNKLGNINPVKGLHNNDLCDIDKLFERMTVQYNGLSMPVLNRSDFGIIYGEEFGNSILEQKPFYIRDNDLILLLPTAITICIRRLIIEFFIAIGKRDFFVDLYAQVLAKYIKKSFIFGKLKGAPVDFYTNGDINAFRFAESIIEFDINYFFHFIFILDTLENIGDDWFAGGVIDKDHKIANFIDSRIENTKHDILNKDSKNKGCSLIVPCGVGRGLAFGSKFIASDHWLCESISDYDLLTISSDSGCSPHLVWRIVEAEYKLEKFGTRILNMGGLLNLHGFIKSNNYSIIINEDTNKQEAQYSLLHIGGDYKAHTRETVALNADRREVCDTSNKVRIATRAFSESLFSINFKYNLYVPEDISRDKFEAVYINDSCEIWITQNVEKEYDFTLQYKLFDALITWLCKTLPVLNRHNIKLDQNFKEWNIKYELVENIGLLEPDVSKAQILSSFENLFSNSILRTGFNVDILKGFMLEANYSEQAMVVAFLSYLKLDKSEIESYTSEIITNENARLLHFFQARKYREQFNIAEEKPVTMHQIDEQLIKLNLGWSCRKREEGNAIDGISECMEYLNSLMIVVWGKIQYKLKQLEREDLVTKLLVNHEYSDKEKEVWENTFKSNLALQDSEDNLYEVVINKISEYNMASLSSRLVIEMAICECSVNCGKNAGKLDIQELLSLASFMHVIGGLSEAIKYEAVPAKITISSFGDVLFDPSFNDMMVRKYGYKINQMMLNYEADKYGDKFKRQEYLEETNNLIDSNFMNAYVAEFCYTIDDARLFIDFLEDYGLKINKLVYSIGYKELIELFEPQQKEIFIKILDSLILYSRGEWTLIPKPYKETDWQPWKFKRRYSLVMKPIVEIDSFERLLIISPEMLRRGYVNLVRNIYEGYLEAEQFQSKSMQKYIGDTVKNRGLKFNIEVKEKFIALGFEAHNDIKLTRILNKKMENFGDIDVFAWNKEKNIIYAVECKDLETAKTQSEIARQLYEFKGQINDKSKKDRLYKHYLRYKELIKDLDGVRKFVKFDSDFELKVLVVFSNMVPMNFDTNRNFIDEISFCSFDELEQL